MRSICHRCGTSVDPLRTPARIVGARVVSLCQPCAVLPAGTPAVPASDPGGFVVAVESTARAPVARSATRMAMTSASVAAVAFVGYALLKLPPHDANAQPTALLVDEVGSLPAPATAPVAVFAPAEEPAPAVRDSSTFVHPLPGPERLLPENGLRRFGAERPGDRPRECRAGHCGVDLGGKIGMPVLAVRDGVVKHVVRHGGGNGGRFVAIDHGDMVTSYFHLDTIRADLAPDMLVAAGDQIGTLGRSGIQVSPAHLHFTVRLSDVGGRPRYVDPLPYLIDAIVAE